MLKRFFGEGFRVFFLGAGLFAILAMAWWTLYLGVHFTGGMVTAIPFAMAPHEWHGHELAFGYGSAALAGFLLTAVPNWTGATAARHWFIGLAAAVWLAGRLALWTSGSLPAGLVAAVDLAFLPILWIKIAGLLWRRPKPQNVVFLVFLSLFWLGNLAMHLGWAGIWAGGEIDGARAGVMALAGMILVIGGRVGPAFTRNAMHREGVPEAKLPRDPALFTPAMIGLAVLLPLSALFQPGSAVAGAVALAAGLAQLARQSRWGIGFAITRPILAALHVSAAMVGLGLVMTGLVPFTGLSEVAALHLLAIGGVAGMTLAVMSRATLGHSGRPLVAPMPVALAYALLPLAAVLRWVGSEVSGGAYFPAVLAAGLLWIAAFALYAGALLPAFLGPRADR
ncbi:MAG: NnrS family protein [Maritimibacter sp.]|nr:NnrS family protein [Maritimibacter sp.]